MFCQIKTNGNLTDRIINRFWKVELWTAFYNGSDKFQIDEVDVDDTATQNERQKGNNEEERSRPFSVEDKYKGFEELLDVDEMDPDIVVPKDIQGSVRALHYALSHPLTFTETRAKYTDTRRKRKPKVRMV